MKTTDPLFPQRDGFSSITAHKVTESSAKRAIATQDHAVIRDWAERHQAQPATGIETKSGPATLHVTDGGAIVRFNFPAAGKFRPISWDEWFEIFDQQGLLFVYEEEISDRAHELSEARGGEPGHEREDWFNAKRQLESAGASSGRYRFIVGPEEGSND